MDINLLLVIILLPLLGSVFVAMSRGNANDDIRNSLNTSFLVLITNIFLILWAFFQVTRDVSFLSQWTWHILPKADLVFNFDQLSLLLLLAVHLTMLCGVVSLRHKPVNRKQILFFSMIFLGILNGYFCAQNIFSFSVFLSLMVFPLLMQLGFCEKDTGSSIIMTFFVYNFLSALLVFGAVVVIYSFSLNIDDFNLGHFHDVPLWALRTVWIGVFAGLILRLPIWPLYQNLWIWLKMAENPLVYINLNLLPITGIYGLIRFWPADMSRTFSWLVYIFGFFCLLSMFLAALRSTQNHGLRDKLFAYLVTYNLLYLMGALLPTDNLQNNIGYSLFSFIVLLGLFSVLVFHVRDEEREIGNSSGGILCLMPKASFIYTTTVLAGIGLPVTSLFWNNFLILSEIFDYNLVVGVLIMLSISILALALMNNLYILKDRSCFFYQDVRGYDIDQVQFGVYSFMLIVLVLSFLKPLWFVL